MIIPSLTGKNSLGGRITVSINAMCAPPTEMETQLMVAAADEALYAAKAAGKNRVKIL